MTQNRSYAWAVHHHPEYGRTVLLIHDQDMSDLHHAWMYGRNGFLYRHGGYWWDGTAWHRPGQVLDRAFEHYDPRPVRAATTVTAADLLAQPAKPDSAHVSKIADFTAGELARVGRPRTSQFQPYGDRPPRDVLLHVATELFTRQGYGVTTTRSIAERAGMRQATMYYYFSGKEEILAELLESTVAASLTRARRLLSEAGRPASERLWQLCHMEVLALCADPCPGALYLLPEAGSERFGRFHDIREQLRDVYLELLESIAADSRLGVEGAALSLPPHLRTPEGIPDLALLVPETASALITLTAAEQVRAMTGMGLGQALDGVEEAIPATARVRPVIQRILELAPQGALSRPRILDLVYDLRDDPHAIAAFLALTSTALIRVSGRPAVDATP
ncbi:TetR/AcrR family transcriptional regulator [Streptomyces sp. ISL-86]|uniref:TetR/AcrR family transcriptional regulator n=1 Tax=Streptomyces sp. ISL-86 TaxID=2819187 RepID=UPI001BE63226|nr:TetR/AcrR family transcriptional regulator [Streptomyces sp. ISL-86]MBT2460000.1 TetR/AcrR family transcriptional regulator [Streptomyces sp. ISL-86]